RRDQSRSFVAAHPGRGPHDLEGRRRPLAQLRSRRRVVHHETRDLRRSRGADADARALLDRARGAARDMMSRALRVLLVEDDDDDFVLFGAMARSLPGWTLERVATGDAALARLGHAADAEAPFDAC